MKYNVMKKWVKALRSGEYKQTRGTLVDRDGFCCLGVLCDIANKENVVELHDYQDRGNLPCKVMKWSGIEDSYGERKGRRKALAILNDFNRYSFKKIANVIEKEYKDL
mgnify:CR=1 FL=1